MGDCGYCPDQNAADLMSLALILFVTDSLVVGDAGSVKEVREEFAANRTSQQEMEQRIADEVVEGRVLGRTMSRWRP